MTAYKLVPLEATQKMIEAGNEAADIYRPGDADMYVENMDECYRAMIAAAPDPDGPLIAAAPDMFAELQECQSALSSLLGNDPDLIARVCGSTTLGNRLVHVRAAIAAATGSASSSYRRD